MPPTPDAIDQALDVTHGAPLQALRAERADFVAGAEACRAAVLTPDEDLGLSVELRAAVARRVARGSHNARLIEGFPQPSDPELAALAAGEMPRDPALRLLGEHADRIAAAPGASGAGHLRALQEAGYTVAQIVALSELLAYVCYQIRVVHGLGLLKDPHP